ncbi:MAG: two-component system response regulator CreB [Pseudomonadota bacterium]
MKHILIVEDEPSIAEAVVHALEAESFSCHWLDLGAGTLALLEREAIDLIILDVGLPDTSGFELCREIKAVSDVPIIFLTARQEEIDKLIGLEIGGDDYVTKPFSLRELVSRVKVVLRRYTRTPAASVTVATPDDRLQVDDDAKCITYVATPLDLTRYEYRLLKTLAEQPNRVFSRDHLMQAVWEDPDTSFERAVDTHIKTLRKKLRAVDPDAMPIKTHHGLGYSYTSVTGKAG